MRVLTAVSVVSSDHISIVLDLEVQQECVISVVSSVRI